MNTSGAIVVLLAASLVTESFAAATNDSALVEGRALAQQLLALKPETGFTNIGKLVIRGPKKQRREVDYKCRVIVTETNWTSHYSASQGTNVLPGFSIEHPDGTANRYFDDQTNLLSSPQIVTSFAGSDFSLTDLGLDFFHWSDQRVVKWEMKRSFGCKVLESRNPQPIAGGYSRVVSWIHTETGGLIQAEAYDVRGKLLKEFRPTETEKVNGRHELKEMEIENVQANTRTTLVFDL